MSEFTLLKHFPLDIELLAFYVKLNTLKDDGFALDICFLDVDHQLWKRDYWDSTDTHAAGVGP